MLLNFLNDTFNSIPTNFSSFVLVAVFSLLIGLEQRRHYIKAELDSRFGTDRTFTLIGILGFILYLFDPKTYIPFLLGALILSLFLAIFYYQKIKTQQKFGLTSILIAIITYCLTPLIYTQSMLLVFSIVISVLILTEIKETLLEFSQKFDNTEFITLSKFLIIAGVILPILPEKPISDIINISPYKFWLSVVAVSGISYLSYLLKKFVFPKAGILLTGIVGGLYSSTASTIILAKESKTKQNGNKIITAILLATGMMYFRILVLALVFNQSIALKLIPSFGIFIATTAFLSIYFYKKSLADEATEIQTINSSSTNPLEFKTSLLFAFLFIVFALITSYVNAHFGTSGIEVLSFVVGVTDIDPFILNVFQSKWNIEFSVLAIAIINAISSNNFIKMIYATSLCDKSIRIPLIVSFGILIILGLISSFLLLNLVTL